MSHNVTRQPTSTLPSHIRPSSSLNTHQASTSNATTLQSRITAKRAELASLRQLRDLSAGLASQMQQLEEKLATLSNGTEVVAAVMGNWGAVLRAVNMASAKIPRPAETQPETNEDDKAAELPQTLVRVPIQEAEAAAARRQRSEEPS